MTTALNLDAPTPTLDHYLCSLPEDKKMEFLTTMLNEHLRLREQNMKASEDSNTLTLDVNDPRRKRRRGVLSHPTVNVAGDRGVYALTSAMKDCLYAHKLLYKRCGILHGNINTHTIRVYWLYGIEPVGVLQDYDTYMTTWKVSESDLKEAESMTPPAEYLQENRRLHMEVLEARLKRVMEEEAKNPGKSKKEIVSTSEIR